MAFRRSFTPVLDGGLVNIGDGSVRKQSLKIDAGEYTPPVWARTESGVVIPITSLPYQGVIEAGQLEILSSAPGGGGASLTRGAGANIPNGGAGWTRWHEVDVTQNDQSVIKAALGSLANIGFIGGRWTAPDGDGSGAYFDQVVGGRRCMEFRWGAGGSSEGRCALHELSTGTNYDEMYQRCIIRLTAQEHWPSNSIKLLRTLRNNGGTANGFFNLNHNVASFPPTPWQLSFTNMLNASGATEYETDEFYGPSSYDEWFELEVWTKKNTADGVYDGRCKAWIGDVGSTVLVGSDPNTGFDAQPGVAVDVSEVTDGAWVSGAISVGHGFYDLGPYLGGAPGIALSQDQSIYFATHSIWVK